MVGVEMLGGLTAKSLQPMVERLLGITRDVSVKPAQQLAAVRVIIGFERQQFGRAMEELIVRRLTDPDACGRPIDSVISPAIIEYLFNFLTSLIQRPDISDRIAIGAGNLIHSLQRLVLAEQRWYRVQSTPKPSRERKNSRSSVMVPPDPKPPSDVGKRSRRRKDYVERPTVNNIGRHVTSGDRFEVDADWPTGNEFHVPELMPTSMASGFA